MPFFSIIIPTYNRAHILPKAIESIIAQSFSNWECIIVDDGSTDTTKSYIESIPDKRFIYVYQKNSERSAARNNGINIAEGTYICFLDSDDYFLPHHLDILYKETIAQNIPEKMFYISQMTFKNNYNTFEKILKSIIHSQHVCIHSSILKNNQFNTNLSLAEDTELWMRIALNYPLHQIHANTVCIVDHDERTISFSQNNSYKKNLRVFKSIFRNKKWKNKISSYVKRTIKSDCYFGIAKYHIFHNQKIYACIYIIASIVQYPKRQFKHKVYTLISCISILSNILNIKNEYQKHSK